MSGLDFLTLGFMQRAIITAVAGAICCSMIGLYLVLKRYSLFGDALSHTAFSGIALGLFLNVYPLWTAAIVSISAAVGMTKLRKSTRISGDAAIALMFTSGLGIGVILLGASKGYTIDLFSFLFGSVLLTDLYDVITILAMAAGVITVLLILRKPLLHFTFDEEQAKVNGVPVEKLNYLFIILAAITVIVTIRLVGILLISALIVLPNITSILMGKGFKKTMLISISLAVSASVAGIILSYPLNLPPSGVIVMMLVAALVGTLLARQGGLLSQARPKDIAKTEELTNQ
jgi:zinc transport system permease protein